MMQWLLPSFELVTPVPPYPAPWDSLNDVWDHPIWTAAKMSRAQYVVSENTHDSAPRRSDGRHVYQGVEYIRGDHFLALLTGGTW